MKKAARVLTRLALSQPPSLNDLSRSRASVRIERITVHYSRASALRILNIMPLTILSVFLWGCLLFAGATTLKSCYSLFQNYLVARQIGVRFHVIPISHLNHFWMLVDKRVLRYVRRYFGESVFTRYNWMGWELPDRYSSHHELGDVFMLVTPGRNWLYIGHPDIVMEVTRRRDDFPRCVELTEVLDVFGPSVATVRLNPWAFHVLCIIG